MDEVPELPFIKILSYLSLEDRLKLRAVSMRWYNTISSFKVKSLCYSEWPSGCIWRKSRWVSGAFTQNFIISARFESFFKAYGRSVLSNLKHLRLCNLRLDLDGRRAFTRTLNSFGQLEELDIVLSKCSRARTFKLKLPMLTSIYLEDLFGLQKLTLDAPKLRKIEIVNYPSSSLKLDIVHGESVESLIISHLANLTSKSLEKLTNLKYLNIENLQGFESTFLSSLKQLKVMQLRYPDFIEHLFEQKQRYGRADLKIYLSGLLLNGPDDPAISLNSSEIFRQLTENESRLADVITFWYSLCYSAIELVVPESLDVWNRFTDLSVIYVSKPVRDIEHFLDLLKRLDNIKSLDFRSDQPQELFDRLPEYCAIERLDIDCEVSNLQFLFRLKHLISLEICWSIDAELIRNVFEEFPYILWFNFEYLNKFVKISIEQPRQFWVWVDEEGTTFSELNAAIQFITGSQLV